MQNDDNSVFNVNGTFASFDSSNVLLENLYLTENHAYNGGGIGVFRLIGPRINNVIVENNTAKTMVEVFSTMLVLQKFLILLSRITQLKICMVAEYLFMSLVQKGPSL